MDKTKKKSVKRYILWGILALAVLCLAMLPVMARQQQTVDGPVASILEAEAKTGSVGTSIHGGGTLEAEDSENVEIPADVKITEFLVKNGDEVKEGDPVARVDKVSVLTAVTQVRTALNTVEKQIAANSDEKASTTVTAPAGGRVKAVYAQVGDRVETVLLEHGGLALLSLDGRMSVTVSAQSSLLPGDSLNVTLDTGKTVTGRVESNLSGQLTVTIEDKGYQPGQTVTLENLGTGALEIHSPWLATAFSGTVSAVNAKAEQTLSSGAALFTLKDTDYTAQQELLSQTHRDYEELLQKLLTWQETGLITAPCGGLISGIDTDSAHLLAAQETELTASPLAAGEDDFRLVLLSSVTGVCTGDASCTLSGTDSHHQAGCPKACKHSESAGVCTANEHFNDCIESCTHADNPEDCHAAHHKPDCIRACVEAQKEGQCTAAKHYDSCIESCIASDGTTQCPAKVHKKDCIESCVSASTAGKCQAGHHKNDCIEACIVSGNADDLCPATHHKDGCFFQDATYTATFFKVSSVGAGTLVGYGNPNTYTVVKTASGWALADGATLDQNLFLKAGTLSAGAGSFQAGDIVISVTVHKGDESIPLAPALYQRSGGQNPGGLPFPGFSIPSMGGLGGLGTSGSSGQSQLYSLTGDILMTVTSVDTLKLTISVDETDISSVQVGMPAELTMNALPDEEFEGEVTRVSKTGSGNGGSSKFDVEITLSRESGMLPGMSATAELPLYEKMDVLTLPVAALVDDGGKTLVYTGKDRKTGEPTNPVEVTTGISDGETVEILSGISSGTTVYYRYYDTVTESDAVETASSFRVM